MKGKFTPVIVIVAALFGTFLLAPSASASDRVVFRENFSRYPATSCPRYTDGDGFGPWKVQFTGYGCVHIKNEGGKKLLEMSPQAVTKPSDTSAPLVVGPSFSAPFAYKGSIATIEQLRQNSAPNAWETAWVIWNYTDNYHFYYFIPKENGWELGKEDPAYPGAQRFLATGSTPTYPVKSIKKFEVRQVNNTMTVFVNGTKVVEFTDNERPYTSGRIGLYSEDAKFTADNIVVTKPRNVRSN